MSSLKFTVIAIGIFFLSWILGSAYSIYNFPKKVMVEVYKDHIERSSEPWKFHHMNDLVDADFRKVVRPSLDFLYSSAVLDASYGSYILSIPAIDRYFVFQFMEDDTDVFDYVGSRTYGKNKKLDVLIVPKEYEGPDYGLPVVRLKTEKVWLLARYQLFNSNDLKNVQAIQNKVKLIPVSAYKMIESNPNR